MGEGEKRSREMDTLFKIENIVGESQREESFPIQEQVTGSAAYRTLRQGFDRLSPAAQGNADVPAAVIFAERLAETIAGVASPLFIP
jgi:hypothetical protein